MAFGGSAAYIAASTIPASEAAVQNAYTRHVFARATAVPGTADLQVVSGLRNGFNADFCHDELAWNHTNSPFHRSNYHRSGGYVSAQMSSGSFAVDTWVSIAATWDGVNVRSYVNGVLDGTSANSSVPTAGSSQIVLNGGSNYSGTPAARFASGETAELALWDVVLTVDEIASLAKGFRATRVRPNNLVFYTPVVRGHQDLIAGRTLGLAQGSETITAHPRVFG